MRFVEFGFTSAVGREPSGLLIATNRQGQFVRSTSFRFTGRLAPYRFGKRRDATIGTNYLNGKETRTLPGILQVS